MKRSVSFKLFLGIGCLGLFFICVSWILNTQYLETYYISKKKNMLLESGRSIDKIYTGHPEAIELEIEKLENQIGGTILILDSKNGMKSKPIFPTLDRTKRQTRLPIPQKRLKELLERKYVFMVREDTRLKTDFLTFIFLLHNGDILYMLTPLAAISESVGIANDFFLFIWILMIVLGGILTFVFSKKFTNPILEVSNIAQHMAKFDFSKKCVVKTDDEIGELAKSINYLSDQLNQAITELNEKNQKLMEDIERERRIDEMRKEFISSVSHELKTPIALIQGYAEGLKVNVVEDEESKNFYCDVIEDETQKMDKLVKDLLDLSQLESGTFKLEKSIFDIFELVDQVLEKYNPIFVEKGISLQVEKEENIFVNADRIRIEQVLSNYINNAINHIEGEKIIKVTVKTNSQNVDVSVYNSGKGIPKASIDNIWTSFYKVDKARTRAYGGSGLGLSVVRSIMELHRNRYGAENVENGVRFWFELTRAGEITPYIH